MRLFSSLVLATLLFAVPSQSNPTNAPVAVSASYEAIQACAVTVVTERGSGSGVVVKTASGEVFVWTAAHVLGTSKSDVTLVKLAVVNGRTVGRISVDAEVLASDTTNDIAVLKPRSNHFFKTGAKFEVADYVPKLGEAVVHVGSLRGFPGAESVTTGIVSFAGRVMDGLVFDQTTATATPGSSGGGVWNSEEKLIGIVVSGYGDTFSFIVPVRRIAAWAAEQKHPEWISP